MKLTVEVWRGDIVESRHRVSLAAVDAEGRTRAAAGDPALPAFMRSCAKFFQAIPLITSGAADNLGIGPEELALACASHNGEERHVAVAHRLLERSGSTLDDLVCGPHSSLSDRVAAAMTARAEKPTRAHNNCSGKHAAMLALAEHSGWSRAGYAEPGHPVQQACLAEMARWADLGSRSIPTAPDGCGVPSFALPLHRMALAFARLAAAATGETVAAVGPQASAAARWLVDAVRAEPFLLAGTDRLDTDLIAASGGRVVAKVGAEGVYCAAIPELGLGIALKVEDGATRALGPALLAALDCLAPGLVPDLKQHREVRIADTRGKQVGRVVARVEMHTDA